MRVLFCDHSHPQAYDFDTLKHKAIGGTESSLLRLAKILANNGHRMSIWQQARNHAITQNQIQFIGPNDAGEHELPERIVVLRKDKQLKFWQNKYPQAKTYLWLHTYKKPEFVFKRLHKHNRQATFIGNSETHKTHLDETLHHSLIGRFFNLISRSRIKVSYGYNPVPKPKLVTIPKRQLNKLLFLSAPNKGLPQVLKHFDQVKKALPDMQLFIANPGYREDQPQTQAGVHYLGPLPQAELWQHLAESLCVFYPQSSFAETFGLIYVEANALGTPILAHDIGAADEILHPDNGTIDANNSQAVINTLQQWQEKLPAVNYREKFSDDAIYQQWAQLLNL